MKRYFIVNHLGLGDHILCNGIYRHYCGENNIVIIPVKPHNVETVQDMLSDKSNAKILSLDAGNPDNDMVAKSIEYAAKGYEVIRLGHFGSSFLVDRTLRYDNHFYNQAGIDFKERWDSFHVPRNMQREEEIYKFLGCDEQEYVFLHEDTKRGFIVDRRGIDDNYKIVSPVSGGLGSENKFRFCDYRKVIENAAEIHCIESSFCALIESLNIGRKRYAHRYCRPEASRDFCHEFTYRNDWNIVV